MSTAVIFSMPQEASISFSTLPTTQPSSRPHTKLASLSSIQLTADRPRGASLLSAAQEEGLQWENKSR